MSEWHFVRNGEQHGPVTEDALRAMLASGQVGPTDLVWKDGMEQWQEARSVSGLVPASLPGVPDPLRGSAPPVMSVPAASVQPVAPGPSAASGQPPTSGKAVGSLVCSILGFFVCAFFGHLIGIILGYSARKEIRNSGGALGGEGMAKAGIILGWIGVVFTLILMAVWIAAVLGLIASEWH